jgi:hypothetical protein
MAKGIGPAASENVPVLHGTQNASVADLAPAGKERGIINDAGGVVYLDVCKRSPPLKYLSLREGWHPLALPGLLP